VQDGLVAYYRSDPRESLRLYEMAERALGEISTFDLLWIQLKKADSRLRSMSTDPKNRQIDLREILELLDHVIDRSRDLHFDWLLGQALVSKGNLLNGTSKQDEILPLWNEGVRLLVSSGATRDAARPLYYLAYVHGIAGDTESSLSFAYRSLRISDPKDHVRLAQLFLVRSLQINRLVYPQYAGPIAREALQEAILSSNPPLQASVMPVLAATQPSNVDVREAEQYLFVANRPR